MEKRSRSIAHHPFYTGWQLKGKGLKKAKGINTNLFMQVYDMPAPQVKDASKLLKNKLLSTYLYDISTRADKVVHITL